MLNKCKDQSNVWGLVCRISSFALCAVGDEAVQVQKTSVAPPLPWEGKMSTSLVVVSSVSSWIAISHSLLQFNWLLSSAWLKAGALAREHVKAGSGDVVLSYYDLLPCFLFFFTASGRSCWVQEVRWKLWAEPSLGSSLHPKTAPGGSNRMGCMGVAVEEKDPSQTSYTFICRVSYCVTC